MPTIDTEQSNQKFGGPQKQQQLQQRQQPQPQPNRSQNEGASKLATDCSEEQRASLHCIQENYDDKDVACKPYFEAYKYCRKLENKRRLEANAKRFLW